jgi:hypothetical protein
MGAVWCWLTTPPPQTTLQPYLRSCFHWAKQQKGHEISSALPLWWRQGPLLLHLYHQQTQRTLRCWQQRQRAIRHHSPSVPDVQTPKKWTMKEHREERHDCLPEQGYHEECLRLR